MRLLITEISCDDCKKFLDVSNHLSRDRCPFPKIENSKKKLYMAEINSCYECFYCHMQYNDWYFCHVTTRLTRLMSGEMVCTPDWCPLPKVTGGPGT